ncbi:MAG: class I SAM-dependent methyltransferase [Nitrospirae bacterium YQR-1]
MKISDDHITTGVDVQNVLDIFKGQWICKLPPPYDKSEAGAMPLFEDPRLLWAQMYLGGFHNRNILELGPVEGAYSYMLEKMGAQSVLSIETNSVPYMKCLIIKEILELKRSRFHLGNLTEYLRVTEDKFDVCIASGVLYQDINPVELISLISRVCDKFYLWSHYYDKERIKNNALIDGFFTEETSQEHNYQGFKHTLYRYYYGGVPSCSVPDCTTPYSHWMLREDILSALRFFGFEDIQPAFEQPEHPNGPAFSVACFK